MAPKQLAPLKSSPDPKGDEASRATPFAALGMVPTSRPNALSPPVLRTPKKSNFAATPRSPSFASAENAYRTLKADVLAVQLLLDADCTLRPTIQMRQLEAELFRIDGIPSHDDRVVLLLDILATKCAEIADQRMPSAANQTADAHVSSIVRLVRAAAVGGAQASNLPTKLVMINSPVAGTTTDLADTRTSVIPSMLDSTDAEPKPTSPATHNGGIPADAVISTSAAVTSTEAQRNSKPLTAEARSLLAKLGIEVPPNEELDVESVLRRLVATARNVHTAQQQVEHRLRTTNDASAQTIQRLHLEIDALRSKLIERDQLVEDLRVQTSASRFSANVQRSLVTINDAPMSFEVERGYKRELKFCADRIKELEDAYAKLLEAGQDDRDRVKYLTGEVAKRDDAIADAKRFIAKTEAEREEQRQLFLGVSRTRGEEARMSLVAVKQLESRVESLSDQLQAKTAEADNYLKSLRSLYSLWCATEDKLKAAKETHRELEMEYAAYKSVYNNTLADELFVVQDDLVKALSLADQREATVMVQRQQLDDVEVLKNLAAHESQLWMERLKASNEWKLINAKASEETKQLTVRLLMLTGDKEKKEAAMAASQQERLNLFKQRAEREINERLMRHREQVDMKQPTAHQDELRLLLEAAADQRRKEDDENDELRLPPKLSALEDYLTEAAKKPSDPRAFFSQWLESKAQQQQQMLLGALGR